MQFISGFAKNNSKKLIKFLLFLLVILSLQTVLTYVVLEYLLMREPNRFVEEISARIISDLDFKDGKWDTTRYNSDPLTPYPNASTSFPVYIVTNEGFVIERSKTINGLLDTSDFQHLVEFEQPGNINTLTNENWRVKSKKIEFEGDVIGVIFVSYYNPDSAILAQTDKKLSENLQLIESQLSINAGQIDVSKVDVRNIHYDVSFEIVTKFNKVLKNNGRTPSFIDTSYIEKEIHKPFKEKFKDQFTNEEYLISRNVIKDENGKEIGIIIVGESIKSLHETLSSFLIIAFILIGTFTLPTIGLTVYVLKDEFNRLLNEIADQELVPETISFNKKESYIKVNNQTFEIAFDSNQYHLCKAIFTNPKKKWEQDEILEMKGETFSLKNSRKIYDSALAINKKLGFKLVDYSGKYFWFNKELTSLITQ